VRAKLEFTLTTIPPECNSGNGMTTICLFAHQRATAAEVRCAMRPGSSRMKEQGDHPHNDLLPKKSQFLQDAPQRV